MSCKGDSNPAPKTKNAPRKSSKLDGPSSPLVKPEAPKGETALPIISNAKPSSTSVPTVQEGERRRSTENTEVVHEKIVSKKLTSSSAEQAAAEDTDADVFVPPPNNQRTFYFAEDDLEFSSEFDSGNLIQVERLGPYRYNFYNAMDCGNSAKQTNNRQWFHFSVRGGGKGVSVTVTFVGVMHSNMFTYEWMPVMALYPDKPEYVRIPGRATVVSLENMPSTPDYPLLEYKVRGGDDSDAEQPNDNPEGNNDETPTCTPTTDNAVMVFAPNKPVKKKKKAKKKKDIAMNLTFEFRMEAAIPRDSPHSLGSVDCPAMYIASNHPYSFSALQRQLTSWQVAMLKQISETRAMKLIENPTNPYKHNMTLTATDNVAIYFHREVLCHSLENRPVELLTITDLKGIDYTRRMPMISAQYNIPLSSSPSVKTFCTERPYYFEGKAFVVLTARVHPGECPGSHMMHGAISFLLNRKDARAQMLRERFVFLIVPMINPDGVVRGHSRVDANGIDLNRMYSTPSQRMQPVPFCLRQLLIPLAMRKQLSLFVDMHAHANKKGAFLYGNGLPAEDQVKSLLYAKLVSLNTPFLDYNSCNYSETNMFAVGKSGKSKDSSARIVLFVETGFVFSYAIETSHVCAKTLNSLPRVDALTSEDLYADTMSLRFTPNTFGDTGKGLLLGLLDLHRCNPISRIPLTPFGSVDSLEMYLEKQLRVEACEKIFTLAYKDGSRLDGMSNTQNATQYLLNAVPPEEFPEKITIRGARNLPIVTFSGVRQYLPLQTILATLEQTPPVGPPRSLYYSRGSRNTSPAIMAPPAFPEYASTEQGGEKAKEKRRRSTSKKNSP